MELEKEIEKVEQEFIMARKQFTALDVGNELKRRGVAVRQRRVSPVVREHFNGTDLYAEAEYLKQLIPVKDGAHAAFLYFPVESDPDEYTATNQDALPYRPNYGISMIVAMYVTREHDKN